MNSFLKLSDGSWGVALEDKATEATARVWSKGKGEMQTIALGGYQGVNSYGRHVYTIAPKPQAEQKSVGDLNGILALFAKAKQHLKFPAIVLGGVPRELRISVATERAKVPGSLTITSGDKADWYGRVLTDGTFQPSRAAPAETESVLKRFAADPAGVASAHGKLTGRCCFCNRGLQDERSTAVGYGPVCADNFGLPWGSARATFTATAA